MAGCWAGTGCKDPSVEWINAGSPVKSQWATELGFVLDDSTIVVGVKLQSYGLSGNA